MSTSVSTEAPALVYCHGHQPHKKQRKHLTKAFMTLHATREQPKKSSVLITEAAKNWEPKRVSPQMAHFTGECTAVQAWDNFQKTVLQVCKLMVSRKGARAGRQGIRSANKSNV